MLLTEILFDGLSWLQIMYGAITAVRTNSYSY